jgi:hypothetical protein
MLVWGGYRLDETLASQFREALKNNSEAHPGRRVTYKRKKNNWFVVSGFMGKQYFIRRPSLKTM